MTSDVWNQLINDSDMFTPFGTRTDMKKLGTVCCCRYIVRLLLFLGLKSIDHVDSMDIRLMLTSNGFDSGNAIYLYLETLIGTWKSNLLPQSIVLTFKRQICRVF